MSKTNDAPNLNQCAFGDRRTLDDTELNSVTGGMLYFGATTKSSAPGSSDQLMSMMQQTLDLLQGKS
jgi:bacteriocin-like protein